MTIEEKRDIRRAMRARRKGLAVQAKALADAAVRAKLAARDDLVRPGKALAVYLAAADEIDLDPFIAQALRAGAEVAAPRWNGETYELVRVAGLDEKFLKRGPMGIREPAAGESVPAGAIAAWIVPGLAFTRGGARLGYGGGWYDRFLASASRGAVKVGVAYAFQIVESLPCEAHDIPLDAVVDDSPVET